MDRCNEPHRAPTEHLCAWHAGQALTAQAQPRSPEVPRGRNAWRSGNQAAATRVPGPYHHFRVLRDVLVPGWVQDHPAGVRVEAVDVEDAVLDVPACPLEDLPDIGATGEAGVTESGVRETPKPDPGLPNRLGKSEVSALMVPVKPGATRLRALVPLPIASESALHAAVTAAAGLTGARERRPRSVAWAISVLRALPSPPEGSGRRTTSNSLQ